MSVQDPCSPLLPEAVWPVAHFPRLEKYLCETEGISPYTLMERAGQAAFARACQLWPEARHWRVLCGGGNNGGDGYIIARLAKQAGYQVTLVACDWQNAPPEAHRAREKWLECGGKCTAADGEWPGDEDLIIDGLLGIGLNRAPQEPYCQLIRKTLQRSCPVLALDIPSGLMADTGAVPGEAIKATVTLSFIALKAGLLTGQAREYCGKILVDPLGPSLSEIYSEPPIRRKDTADLSGWILPRNATAHKGNNGRLLLAGGDEGTGGAIRLAAEAALRSGAGLVRVLTHPQHVTALLAARPELMVAAVSEQRLQESIDWADIVVTGPGLGQRDWGRRILAQVKK